VPTIRLATPADAYALAQLRWDFRASVATPIEEEAAFLERCTSWMRPRLEPGEPWTCWALDDSGEVAGQLWLQLIEKLPNPVPELERHAYITNVYVVPRLRGAGLGAALLETALAYCREQSVDSVILWPTPQSRTLYQRHGFAVRNDLMELNLNDGRHL
jgi:GNAT superfamily N-acetyltransferase